MKIKLISILLLTATVTSPGYGDYKDFLQELETYSPPPFFTQMSQSPIPDKAVSNRDQPPLPAFAHIKQLRQDYKELLNAENGIPFLGSNATPLYERIAGMAADAIAVQDRVAQRIVLEEIEILAALRHPAVLLAQKKVLAQIESFNQVMNLDDNLTQYSAFTRGINTQAGPVKMKDSIAAKYPYPGLTSLKGAVIRHGVDIQLEKMEVTRRDVITKLRNAYWSLVYVDASTQITKETIIAFNRLKDVATTLYKSGRTSFQDMIKINIKIALLKEALLTLESKKENIRVAIVKNLNLPADQTIGRPVVKTGFKKIDPPEALFQVAREHRPELKILRASVARTQTMIEMAESMIMAPFSLNLSLNENDAVNTAGTGAPKQAFPEKTMAAMKNNLPARPWYGLDDPWLRQTRHKLAGLKQALIKEENATDSLVQDTWFLADKHKRELVLNENLILSLSKSALDVSTREYESGAIVFAEAIDSYTSWLDVKLRIAQKQKDLRIAMAALEQITGTPL